MRRWLAALTLMLATATLGAGSLLPGLTLSRPGTLPWGPQDQGWEDDPSALAESPSWDLRGSLGYFDSGAGSALVTAQSGAKGLADEGGFGLRWAQASVPADAAKGEGGDGSAVGGAYGWALGAGAAAGLSLWQAQWQWNGGTGGSLDLVGLGLRATRWGQILSVNALTSKDGLVRPTRAVLGGCLGGAWTYGATAEADGSGLRGAQAVLGWGPGRILERYLDGRHSLGLGLDWVQPAWDLTALAAYGMEDQLSGQVALSFHGYHVYAAFNPVQIDSGWHSWSAPPPPGPAAGAEGDIDTPPAIPDVDPEPAPPVSSTKIK